MSRVAFFFIYIFYIKNRRRKECKPGMNDKDTIVNAFIEQLVRKKGVRHKGGIRMMARVMARF